ncbi:MAG: efflux RND transporter periplasmic adaptor subunit [Leptospiraceae bacterium]|nr:efflux RND transporter periplasmic adaptor subunit [Leptospiraceae bacterium]MCP5497299.1 efflux RND transporter periplasmic adaptor subunit [Leptospiraceae bacterium]
MKYKFIFIIIALVFAIGCKGKKKDVYYCPMHPDYTSDRFGQCPICNMDLVLKEEPKSNDAHDPHKETAADAKQEDNNTLILNEEKQALIGIKTEMAENRKISKTIYSSGTVAYDPDLYTALVEYKEILKNPIADSSSNQVASAARVKLTQLGLSDEQIRYYSSRNPSELISGRKGSSLIFSQIYEKDINLVKKGMPIKVTSSSFPDKIFVGTIISLDAVLDSQNRTLRAHSIVKDPSNLLKPQMFADVEISVELDDALTVPSSAIINTGRHRIVYTRVSNDRFRPVCVITGAESDQYVQIIEGLEEGDEVVTEANFLLDSEAKMNLKSMPSMKTHKHE